MFIVRVPKILSLGFVEANESSSFLKNNYNISNLVKRPWKTTSQNSLSPALLDIDWLTLQPLLPFLVQVIPPHLLYRSLVAHGLEESIEVIEWVRGEQLLKILDFDLWHYSGEFQVEDVSAEKFLSWLRCWLEISSEFAVDRVLELEEESIVLIFSKLFHIVPNEGFQVTEDIQENWWQTEDKKFFLKLYSEDNATFEIVKIFVDQLYMRNARLAGSVFAHAAMLVRQESLEMGLRWRQSRLSDQGFVAFDEALKVLAFKKEETLLKSITDAKILQSNRKLALKKFGSLSKNLTMLEGSLSSSSESHQNLVSFLQKLDEETGVVFIQQALSSDSIKQIANEVAGSENKIALESFYDDEEFIDKSATEILVKCQHLLNRVYMLSHAKNENFNLLIENVIFEIHQNNYEMAELLKQQIARLGNVFLSATAKSFEHETHNRSLEIVRGLLNIGLEICLKFPETYSLELNASLEKINHAVYCVTELGIDFIFQVGWHAVLSLAQELANQLVKLDSSNVNINGKLKTIRKIKLSDGHIIEISLAKIVLNQRYSDVGLWLSEIENTLSPELFVLFESLLNQVPLYLELVSSQESSNYVSRSLKPFETIEEINKIKKCIDNLEYNLNLE